MTTEKVKEVQEYLKKKGIVVAETSIINAAIKIATHRDGNAVFISEFEMRKRGDGRGDGR